MKQVPNPDHPGWYLRKELEARKWTNLHFADLTGINVTTVSRIIQGGSSINAKRAIAIGKTFGTGPEVWMNLQAAYDLWQAGYRSKS